MSAWISSPALQHGQVILFLQKLYIRVIAEKLWPQGSVSFVWSGLSCRKCVSGRHGSLDSAIESRVSGHSSSFEGIDRVISIECLIGLVPLRLKVSFVGFEMS